MHACRKDTIRCYFMASNSDEPIWVEMEKTPGTWSILANPTYPDPDTGTVDIKLKSKVSVGDKLRVLSHHGGAGATPLFSEYTVGPSVPILWAGEPRGFVIPAGGAIALLGVGVNKFVSVEYRRLDEKVYSVFPPAACQKNPHRLILNGNYLLNTVIPANRDSQIIEIRCKDAVGNIIITYVSLQR